ncbi:MAG: NAD-binding protein [Thiomargarita sp.]|nr:NAD-binding protein [Thiomargarita sp.]
MYLQNHLIICNWHSNGERIVKELHSSQAEPNLAIVIITETKVNEAYLREKPEYKNVYFVQSDPTLHSVLDRVEVLNAKSVIILSHPDYPNPDAKTAMISLAITKCDHTNKKRPRIIAEVMNPENAQHLENAGVDEWVCSAGFGLGIIAQTALYGKMSDVYQQLLTYSGETNEIYLLDNTKYPEWFQGKTFKEIARILNNEREQWEEVILIGIKRDEKVILNPKKGQFDTLKSEDSLILVAFDPPNFKKIRSYPIPS